MPRPCWPASMRHRPTATCYLLAAEQHRDADTWGVHLLDDAQQGLDPDYTIADAGQGLRAGQRAAWGDTPCHSNVFHIQRQCEGLANTLARLAKGATSRRQTLQAKMGRTGPRGSDDELATQLTLARQAEAQAHELARDIQTLTRIASSGLRLGCGLLLHLICSLPVWNGRGGHGADQHGDA